MKLENLFKFVLANKDCKRVLFNKENNNFISENNISFEVILETYYNYLQSNNLEFVYVLSMNKDIDIKKFNFFENKQCNIDYNCLEKIILKRLSNYNELYYLLNSIFEIYKDNKVGIIVYNIDLDYKLDSKMNKEYNMAKTIMFNKRIGTLKQNRFINYKFKQIKKYFINKNISKSEQKNLLKNNELFLNNNNDKYKINNTDIKDTNLIDNNNYKYIDIKDNAVKIIKLKHPNKICSDKLDESEKLKGKNKNYNNYLIKNKNRLYYKHDNFFSDNDKITIGFLLKRRLYKYKSMIKNYYKNKLLENNLNDKIKKSSNNKSLFLKELEYYNIKNNWLYYFLNVIVKNNKINKLLNYSNNTNKYLEFDITFIVKYTKLNFKENSEQKLLFEYIKNYKKYSITFENNLNYNNINNNNNNNNNNDYNMNLSIDKNSLSKNCRSILNTDSNILSLNNSFNNTLLTNIEKLKKVNNLKNKIKNNKIDKNNNIDYKNINDNKSNNITDVKTFNAKINNIAKLNKKLFSYKNINKDNSNNNSTELSKDISKSQLNLSYISRIEYSNYNYLTKSDLNIIISNISMQYDKKEKLFYLTKSNVLDNTNNIFIDSISSIINNYLYKIKDNNNYAITKE